MKGSNPNLNSSFKNCIKSLRDIDKPTTSGSYFKLKLDEKPKNAPTNQEFKSIFYYYNFLFLIYNLRSFQIK